jgi:hypothetical protein
VCECYNFPIRLFGYLCERISDAKSILKVKSWSVRIALKSCNLSCLEFEGKPDQSKALRASGGGGSRLLNSSEGMGEAKEMKRLVKLKGTTPYNLLCLARLLKSDAALERSKVALV